MAKQDTSRDAQSHATGTRRGEEMPKEEGKESGHQDSGQKGANRPSGGSTARRSTSINPDDRNPIDPNSPNISPD
jgi:hypothetical protein